MPLFTAENAATLGRQGALARWRKPDPPAIPPPLPDNGTKELADSTRSQIIAIDSRLARAASMDAETLDLLTRSKERLWKILAHAAGIAAPANFKPERKRRGIEAIDLEQIAIVPANDSTAMESNAVNDKGEIHHDNTVLLPPSQVVPPSNGTGKSAIDAALDDLASSAEG